MQLARILMPIPGNVGIEAIAKTAFVLAERFGAEVTGLHAAIPPREQFVIQDEAGAPIQLESLIKEAEAQAEQVRKAVEKNFKELAAAHSNVTASFVSAQGNISATVARYGRLADLTVIGPMAESEADPWLDIRDAAIFQTGRPVVVAPDGPVSEDLGKTLVFAWKDGVEAARALAAARPFIAKADKIRVISAGGAAEDEESLKDAAAYLSLYAGKVETAAIGENRRNVAELLVEEAAKHEGALLIMGAYSQWRWKEWAFGGVTEYVLQSTTIPAMLAH